MVFMGVVLGLSGGLVLRAAAQDGSRDQEAMQLMANRCGICHSTDLVMQQRLDRSRWTATVDKMIRWGAGLSPEERDILVKYLAVQYRPDAPADEKPDGAK
jgi:mono/diheme cytochrome c family protein